MPVLQDAADKQYMLQLPKVSFREIKDDPSLLKPAGVHSEQCKSYGFNDFSTFQQPDFYIRYIEPIESELAVQVEYDMDDQDLEWLESVNAERKKDQSGPVSYEIFEIIMDKLEKEWFDLVKRIPQPASHLPVEDSKCAICDDGEGENSNAIVFCDGCNLAVHQDCYGVPYIPEGQWLCRKCTVSPENPVSCVLCPNEGGAFKQATTGHWAHLLCAIWIPELTVGNAIYMEPIDGMEIVPKSRWKLTCSFCREKTGACIQCDNKACFTAFHVTCARQAGCLMSMKSMSTQGVLRAFCEKHLPADAGEGAPSETESDFSISLRDPEPDAPSTARSQPRARARRESHTQAAPVTTKSARAHAKSYRPGPPIVPQIIVKKLLDYIAKVVMRKKPIFVERLCRYWSLKREARRGAPLLKRLHLEPWTASSNSKEQSDAEKAKKLQFLMQLRRDLEKVRMLAETAKKREKEKLHQTQVIRDIVDNFIFPHYARLRLVLENISAMDRDELFLHPVNRMEVPDYFEVVKEPMCWMWIDDKLEKNSYLRLEDFKRDINLVLDNAMLYNPSDHKYHRTAKRIKGNAQPLLVELDNMPQLSRPVIEVGLTEEKAPSDDVGNLEPSLILLQSLLANPSTDPERDFLSSIFQFAMEKPKPPTPPPSPPKPKTTHKKPTAAETKAKRAARDAAAKERVLISRSTRAVKAMTKAFAEEAGLPPSSDSIEAESSAMGSRRKSARQGKADDDVAEQELLARRADSVRKQRGVVALEPISKISDKERREQERALDLVMDHVDTSDTFQRFNVGWVLPPGSKRNRGGKNSSEVQTPEAASGSKPRKLKLFRGSAVSNSATILNTSTQADEAGAEPTVVGKRESSVFSSDLSDISLTPPPTSPPPRPPSPVFPTKRAGKKRKADEVDVDVDSSPAAIERVKRQRQKSGRSDTMDEEIVVAPKDTGTGRETARSSAKLIFRRPPPLSRYRRGVEVSQLTEEGGDRGDIPIADEEVDREGGLDPVKTDSADKEVIVIESEEEEEEEIEEIEEKEEPRAVQLSDDALTHLPTPPSVRSSVSRMPARVKGTGRFAPSGRKSQKGGGSSKGRGKPEEVVENGGDGDVEMGIEPEGESLIVDGEAEGVVEGPSAGKVKRGAVVPDEEVEEVEETEEIEGEGEVEVGGEGKGELGVEEDGAVEEAQDEEQEEEEEEEEEEDGEENEKEEEAEKEDKKEEEEEEEEEEIEEIEEKEDATVSLEEEEQDEDDAEEEDPYPPGTLVWAKIGSFPHFPAEILEQGEDNPEIPISMFADRDVLERRNQAKGQKTWLVKFFDSNNSYGWIPRDRLDLFKEDDAIDQMYLSARDRQGRRHDKYKKSLQKSYRAAISSMDSDEEA